jgi:hypothetical protein
MKRVALIVAAGVLASPAAARDVTLTFNDEEQKALIQVLDAATRANGIEQAKVTLYFLNKLQAPQQALGKAAAAAAAAAPADGAGGSPPAEKRE